MVAAVHCSSFIDVTHGETTGASSVHDPPAQVKIGGRLMLYCEAARNSIRVCVCTGLDVNRNPTPSMAGRTETTQLASNALPTAMPLSDFKEGGKYHWKVRKAFYDALAMGVHISTATNISASLLSHFTSHSHADLLSVLPSYTSIRRFSVEMGEVAGRELDFIINNLLVKHLRTG